MSDQPSAASAEELERRCGHECLSRPDHDGTHFYGYIMGPHSYEGVKAERDALRQRVAELEYGIESHRRAKTPLTAQARSYFGPPDVTDTILWRLLGPEVTP